MRLQLVMLKAGRTWKIGSIALCFSKCDIAFLLAAHMRHFFILMECYCVLQYVDSLAGHLTELENRVSKK